MMKWIGDPRLSRTSVVRSASHAIDHGRDRRRQRYRSLALLTDDLVWNLAA